MSENIDVTSIDDVVFLSIPHTKQDYLMNKVTIDHSFIHASTSNQRFASWSNNDLAHINTKQLDMSIPLISLISDGEHLYIGSGYETPHIYVYHLSDYTQITTLSSHTNSILDMAIDSSFLYTGSADGTVKIWEKSSWSLVQTLQVQEHFVLSIETDSKYIFAGGLDRMTRVFQKHDCSPVTTLIGHEASIFSLSSDNKYVYSGSGEIMWGGPGSPRPSDFESALRVWDKVEWQCIATKSNHCDNVTGISVDQSSIYTISDDSTLRVYQKNRFDEVIVVNLDFIPKDLAQDSTQLFIATSKGNICIIPKTQLV